MKSIVVDLPQSILYYAAFYTVAFLASLVILVAEGRRRKIPQLPWLILITTGFISFVLGCRIVTYSVEDWKTILSNQPLDHTSGLVMLGGLIICVPCIIITKHLLHLKESVLDSYAFVLPVGMFLQRIGCFLNGCCFGTVKSGWGIQYAPGTSAFNDHYAEGILPDGSVYSLLVHPVQLYEAIGCLLSVLFLIKVRGRFVSAGRLFYLSGLTYYVVRFFTEFFRDSDAYAIKIHAWMGINTIQWLMLILTLGSLAVIFLKQKSPNPHVTSHGCTFNPFHLIYFFALSVTFFFVSKWLRPTEIFVVYMVLFTTAGYFLIELFKTVTVPGFRIGSLSLVLLSLLTMSQTYPEQATSDSTKISYNTLSVGGLVGSQDLSVVYEDCDGNNIGKDTYKYNYTLAAVGFSRTKQTGKAKSFTYGISAFAGKQEEKIVSNTTWVNYVPSPTNFYGVNPYVELNLPKFAIGTGIHAGQLLAVRNDNMPEHSALKQYNFYPQLYLRVGRLDKFFWDINWSRNFPSCFPGTIFQTSLGFSLNRLKPNSGLFRIGTSSSTGIFLAPTIPLGDKFLIEPYVGFAGSLFVKALGYKESTGIIGSLNLHYKFNKSPRLQTKN